MAKVYTGINNYNEYYTNHYFSAIFEENTAARISEWRDSAKISENINIRRKKLNLKHFLLENLI